MKLSFVHCQGLCEILRQRVKIQLILVIPDTTYIKSVYELRKNEGLQNFHCMRKNPLKRVNAGLIHIGYVLCG